MKNFFNKKRIISLVLTLTMLFAMSSMAFAQSSAETITVNLYFQKVDLQHKPSNFSEIKRTQPITVTINSGQTVKDAIDKAVIQNNVLKNAVWQGGSFLSSMKLNNANYENINNYYTENGKNVYEGTSWMYFMGNPNQMPQNMNDYPTEYMNQKNLTSDSNVTLSYETMKFVY